MTLPVGNLGTRFGEGKMAFETTRLYYDPEGYTIWMPFTGARKIGVGRAVDDSGVTVKVKVVPVRFWNRT